jgi:NADPH:quinone reductase-like Zn-dependent oxidoreductase
MKAVVFFKYGGNEVVEIEDVPIPTCGPEDVMIKVYAAGINPVDWKIRYGHAKILTGSTFPKILGNECAGEVADIGSRVKKFKKGDQVIGCPRVRRLGAFAEYACSGEPATFPKSKNFTFEEAACIPIAGLTALQALRDKGGITKGKKVLINGASGGVGHFAVQIAKVFGAEVTGVCSQANVDFVKSLGADRVIDYTQQDFTKGTERYDLIFDAVAKRSFGECKSVLMPNGCYVSTLPSLSVIVSQYGTGLFAAKKARTIMVTPNASDLAWMTSRIETGKIKVMISMVYSLDQAKDALAHSEAGKARGKIVLKMI